MATRLAEANISEKNVTQGEAQRAQELLGLLSVRFPQTLDRTLSALFGHS